MGFFDRVVLRKSVFALWAFMGVVLIFQLVVMFTAKPSPEYSSETWKAELGAYAKRLVAQYPDKRLEHKATLQLHHSEPHFVLKFVSSSPQMMAIDLHNNIDRRALMDNLRKYLSWEDLYCTPELKERMRLYGIKFAHADLLSPAGEIQVAAECFANR